MGKNQIPIAEKPDGNTIKLKFNDDYAFKAKVGAFIGKGFDIALSYGQLKNLNQINKSESFAGTNPIDMYEYPEHDELGPYPNPDDGFIDSSKVRGFGEGSFKSFNIDLETGYTFDLDPVKIRLSAGIRYAEFHQATYIYRENECWHNPCTTVLEDNHREFPFIHSKRSILFDSIGIGPKVGLSFSLPLNFLNLSLIAATDWAILFSHNDDRDLLEVRRMDKGKLDFMLDSEEVSIVDDKDDSFNIINFNIEGGIQHAYKLSETSSFLLTAGYKYEGLYSVRNSYGISRVTDADYGHEDGDSDVISHGPFVRVGFSF